MKKLGYRIFAFMYTIFKWFPIKKNTMFLIMTHDSGREGNVAVMEDYLEEVYTMTGERLVREDTNFSGKEKWKKAFTFFFYKPWKMARAEYIFMDNAFLPMAYLKVRKETTTVQLWHGTGTIKKFGQHVNTGILYEQEKKANENLDYVIVNSKATYEIYAGCFSVPIEKVKILGLPRTDLLFDQEEIMKRAGDFYKEYPTLVGKKLILYAPTFRDHEVDMPKMRLDIEKMVNELPDDYCLLLRLHPFVASRFQLDEKYGNRVLNFSNYDSINTLLMTIDILITDYSSIIFEYCVYKRPMIFFAYDLEEFSDHGRGFYRDYEEYVPGPVVTTTEEIIKVIKNEMFKTEKIDAFIEDSYAYRDGKSAKRVADLVVKGKE